LKVRERFDLGAVRDAHRVGPKVLNVRPVLEAKQPRSLDRDDANDPDRT
jgi:hypothetical protein